jgi:hypothetical protein
LIRTQIFLGGLLAGIEKLCSHYVVLWSMTSWLKMKHIYWISDI